jgi:hypothetical protein
MFMTGRKRDDFAINRKFEVACVTSIREKKHDFGFFQD